MSFESENLEWFKGKKKDPEAPFEFSSQINEVNALEFQASKELEETEIEVSVFESAIGEITREIESLQQQMENASDLTSIAQNPAKFIDRQEDLIYGLKQRIARLEMRKEQLESELKRLDIRAEGLGTITDPNFELN